MDRREYGSYNNRGFISQRYSLEKLLIMNFHITENGLIPVNYKDIFDSYWGIAIFHDYAEHCFGDTISDFKGNILEEIATIGSAFYMDIRFRLKLGLFKYKSLINVYTGLVELAYCVLDNLDGKLDKYNISVVELPNVSIDASIELKLRNLSNMVWDKHLCYNKNNISKFPENYKSYIYLALKIGYKAASERFKNVPLKHIFKIHQSLTRLGKLDKKWFFTNFNNAKICFSKKKIKLIFEK